jgi:hypothetical protein
MVFVRAVGNTEWPREIIENDDGFVFINTYLSKVTTYISTIYSLKLDLKATYFAPEININLR